MVEFVISIAGIPVGIHALYESTRDFCAGYLTDQQPEFTVVSGREIIRREQERSDREAADHGRIPERFEASYLEELAIYREIAERFLDRNILLFHGSVVAVEGDAYLFTARSGTGKSTHTRLWRQMLGDRAVMINDDKPMVKVSPEGCFACGTPWNGKHRLGRNLIVPLKAICVLERAEKNAIQSLHGWYALPLLLQHCYHPLDSSGIPKVLDLLSGIMEHTGLYRMHCNNLEADAAQVSFNQMYYDGREEIPC